MAVPVLRKTIRKPVHLLVPGLTDCLNGQVAEDCTCGRDGTNGGSLRKRIAGQRHAAEKVGGLTWPLRRGRLDDSTQGALQMLRRSR